MGVDPPRVTRGMLREVMRRSRCQNPVGAFQNPGSFVLGTGPLADLTYESVHALRSLMEWSDCAQSECHEPLAEWLRSRESSEGLPLELRRLLGIEFAPGPSGQISSSAASETDPSRFSITCSFAAKSPVLYKQPARPATRSSLLVPTESARLVADHRQSASKKENHLAS